MLTVDSVRTYNNVGFFGGKINKTAAASLVAVTGAAVAAAAKATSDVFVKEAKSSVENDNFNKNMELVSENKNVVKYFEEEYGIKGQTYEELKKRATSKLKLMQIDKAENERNYHAYGEYSDVTQQDLCDMAGRCDEVSGYIDFLDAVAGREYTPEEAKVLSTEVENYRKIQSCKQNLINKHQDESLCYQELDEMQDGLHSDIANYGYSAEIYTWY